MIPFIDDGTYRFSTSGSNKGLLESLVETLPFWQIGHVDATVASRFRTFEDVDVTLNCLGFMLDKMQDAYECIFLFDIKNRLINVYDQSSYIVETSIYLSKDDLINSIDITENADNLYTALTAIGASDEVISDINPIGTNTIYNFSYYLDWMTPSLGDKVSAWQSLVNSYTDSYYNLNLEYYSLLTQRNNLQAEVDRLDTLITIHTRCKESLVASSGDKDLAKKYSDAIVDAGGDPLVLTKDIKAIINDVKAYIKTYKTEKATATASLNSVNSSISVQESRINAIHNAVDFSKYFTSQELQELENYIFEGSYKDEYIVITKEMSSNEMFEQKKLMYDRAKEQLRKASEPTQEFKIDVESFIFEKKFKDFSYQLETGCLINVEIKEGDVAQLFLSSMTVNYDDKKLSLTFGNRYNKFDAKSLFDKVLGNITKTANTLTTIKDIVHASNRDNTDYVAAAFKTSRNITMEAALAATDQTVVIDGSGYTGRKLLSNGDFDPKQVKLTSNSMVFTDDAWETCKTAVGEIVLGDTSVYGINAEVLIGDMVITKDLRVVNDSGTVSIDKDGIKITNGTISWGALPSDVASQSYVSGTYTSITPLYYQATNDKPNDVPGKPTAKVTSTENTTGKWITIIPSYRTHTIKIEGRDTPDPNKIYTCNQMELKGGGVTWTPVVEYVSGQIATQIGQNSVTTSFVNALKVTAVDIAANSVISNKITCQNITITGGSISWSAVSAPDDLAKIGDIPDKDYITNITKNTITSEYINGKELTFTKGSIGGFIITSGGMHKDVKSNTDTYRAYLNAPSDSDIKTTSRAFAIRKTDSNNTNTYPFAVTYGGAVTASNITISGGSINVNDVFKVSTAGKLTCTGADISGKITATSGTIGGWTIDEKKFFTGSTSDATESGMSMKSGNNVFYAGWDGSNAKFSVAKTGKVSIAGDTYNDSRITLSSGTYHNYIAANGLLARDTNAKTKYHTQMLV